MIVVVETKLIFIFFEFNILFDFLEQNFISSIKHNDFVKNNRTKINLKYSQSIIITTI